MNEVTIEIDGLRVTARSDDEGGDPSGAALAVFRAASEHTLRTYTSGAEGVSGSPPEHTLRTYTSDAEGVSGSPPEHTLRTYTSDAEGVSESNSERARRVVAGVLADGRPHERRELARAVRDAGISSQGLDGALRRGGRFERDYNVAGRPVYRDPSVPPPPLAPLIPDSEKPEWMRTPPARNGAGL